MKLMVQSYGSGGYNAEEEETKFLHYTPDHGFDSPAEVTITLSDSTGLLAQKYIIDTSKHLAGGVADDGGAETDETAETNSAAVNDMTLLPAIPVVNDAYYFGFDEQVNSFFLNVGTAAVPVGASYSIIWEYSKGSDVWAALAGVTDNTDMYRNAGVNSVIWTIPGDWATDEVGSISAKYWVRGRLTALDDTPTTIPIGTRAWYQKIWLGPGKVTIEDPDATDIFYGRIMKAEANTDARTVTLYCQDWLSQLDEEQIPYDMREKLSGDIRQSTGHADPDGAFVGVAENAAGTYYFYDDAMAWANDAYNPGMYLILTNGMAGSKEWGTGPYDEVVTGDGAGIDSDIGDETNIWVDDTNSHAVWDNDENWTQDYYFRVYLGHNTPSDFYVHDSISKASFDISYAFKDDDADATCEVQIWDGAAWQNIGDLATYDAQRGQITTRATINIPDLWVDNCVDANGLAKVRFNVTLGTTNAYLYIYYIKFKVTTETTGYSAAITINDTITTNKLEVATDLTAAATRVWEEIPYCITKPIHKHIESATGPILGGDTMVTLTCADGNVEDTSGISTRQFVGKTRLQIAQYLARQDKAHFWIALGTATVTYKSTFNDGAPETLTDTDINSIRSTRDYSTLANKATVYGMRIGDSRLSSTYTDATSVTKYNQTRTKVTSDTGLVSEYDTLARATALVNQYKDVQQILSCTIAGNTAKATHDKTLVLGDEVSITSTYLGLSAAVYIVQRFYYDSRSNLTTLLLHPRVSQIGLQKDERPSFEKAMQDNRRGTADRYIPEPSTNEVA